MFKNIIIMDRFHPLPLPRLARFLLEEIKNGRFMGIPGDLFFRPGPADPFRMERYGRMLETPVGVAAGPHTQLSQNIVAAWLCGARYIELKTIQTLDEITVSKPCIDMQDEGYNCEWSQELKIRESFAEYLNAWILIHILRRELGFVGSVGTIFNMSVGYDLKGIMNPNVQWFLDRMRDCTPELDDARRSIRGFYPAIADMDIPSRISDNITLSTMHGCPPEETGKIGLYLIREKKLHTTLKLNPTLLGAQEVRDILGNRLGFGTEVPDSAFDHDLKYPDALRILESLTAAARENGVCFGIKLTNTLESINNKDIFNPSEKTMYMSGRALHAISLRLAHRVQEDFKGRLDISFSAGADCFNMADLLSCGLKPVTACSDLLKPGGYGRLRQYLDYLYGTFASENAAGIDEFILKTAGEPFIREDDVSRAALHNLAGYAGRVTGNAAFQKRYVREPSIKTGRELGWFDCIHAPCVDTCPGSQDIPEYMRHVAAGDFEGAFRVILRTNPFPSVTGMVCDHPCEMKCTRMNYDEAVHIRDVKRFVAGNAHTLNPSPFGEGAGERAFLSPGEAVEGPGERIAIIGAGPAGLSCGWFLRQAGYEVDIFEEKKLAGGMVSAAIPSFRLSNEALETDIRRILASGVRLHDNTPVGKELFDRLLKDYYAVFLAAGAGRAVKPAFEGTGLPGVLDPLEFLCAAKQGRETGIGRHVVVIGGGNTAMDAARTACRLVGEDGSVTIVYRRTLKEMPAGAGEIEAVRKEGIRIVELAAPVRVLGKEGRIYALECVRNIPAMKDKSGRPAPVSIPGSEFEIPCDTIIPAVGQETATDFLTKEMLSTEPGKYRTRIPGLFVGGDALRGASTIIQAIADGRKAAEEIAASHPLPLPSGEGMQARGQIPPLKAVAERAERSLRRPAIQPAETALHRDFSLETTAYTAGEAQKEASRCLGCDELCSVCVTVCPNRANFCCVTEPVNLRLQKAVSGENGSIAIADDTGFHTEQVFQVMNIRDLCNECGNCTTFCPTGGRPFADKPGLCLSVQTLNEEGSGFFLSRLPDRDVLICKEKDNIRTLTLADGKYTYETNQVRAVINPEDFSLLEVRFLTPCVREAHFSFAAEMSIIMKGAMQMNL